MRPNLISWQWNGYKDFHTDKTSLFLHLFGVPMFVMGVINFVIGAFEFSVAAMIFSLIVTGIGFAVQAIGHKRESIPPIPFDGPVDAVTRIMVEQFITFPRFVLSGSWSRAVNKNE
jgi:hypothetical protein